MSFFDIFFDDITGIYIAIFPYIETLAKIKTLPLG